jgi:hypothetical protein
MLYDSIVASMSFSGYFDHFSLKSTQAIVHELFTRKQSFPNQAQSRLIKANRVIFLGHRTHQFIRLNSASCLPHFAFCILHSAFQDHPLSEPLSVPMTIVNRPGGTPLDQSTGLQGPAS